MPSKDEMYAYLEGVDYLYPRREVRCQLVGEKYDWVGNFAGVDCADPHDVYRLIYLRERDTKQMVIIPLFTLTKYFSRKKLRTVASPRK